ncbi:DUF2075 domain-containing protein, partial [Microbacteriaceae bacterium]|nr:DUF2075 domain-containing protein [Candidatus Saccharibacteria bacterium]
MIVYSNTKKGYLEDVKDYVEDKIRAGVKEKLNIDIKPGSSEYESWKNSAGAAMSYVMDTDKIPDDAGVAIEYSIPRTKNRVDFVITGLDKDYKEKVVVIELKQWTDIQMSDKDAMVFTRFKYGRSEELHPSYQAWSYATLLRGFNATVYEENIGVEPCAYLHNHVDDNVIHNRFYEDYTKKSPAFCKGDKEKLQDFIAKYVKHGDNKELLYRIDNGEVRPSKDLADSLASMLKGNEEFVMIDDQKIVYETALSLTRKSSSTNKNVLIVEGGPGTGKSVVAVNLLVATTKLGLNSQYVTRNSAPRLVYEQKLTGTLKKSEFSNMFQSTGSYMTTEPNMFDALLVDESHRLTAKSGLYSKGENQILEIIRSSKCSVFFIDEDQRVTLKDIGSKQEIRRHAEALGATVTELSLTSQFRCNGSNGYLAWLDNKLQIRDTANTDLSDINYDFEVFDDPTRLFDTIVDKNMSNDKARMLAGYCWKWISRNEARLRDIEIGDFKATWNLNSDGQAWIIQPGSVSEIGCIHTSQGLEVDYVGVIIGPDLIVRDGKVITDVAKRASTDKSVHGY